MSIFDSTDPVGFEHGPGSTGFDSTPFADELNDAFGPAGWTDQAVDKYEQYLAEHPEEMDRCLMAEHFNRFDVANAALGRQLELDRAANIAAETRGAA